MGHKGYYGQYSGNAKWSRNHADTKVTKENYKASERDDAAHIDYLKRDVDYDNKHGHSDSSMTSDEKHISKLAGDMKYDKEHHGSPAKSVGAHSMKPSKYASHLASASEHKAPSDEVIAKRKKEGKKTTGHISDTRPTNTPPTKMVVPKIGTAEKFKKRTDRVIKNASTVVDMEKTIKHAQKFGSGPFMPYRKDPAIGEVGAVSKMVSPLNEAAYFGLGPDDGKQRKTNKLNKTYNQIKNMQNERSSVKNTYLGDPDDLQGEMVRTEDKPASRREVRKKKKFIKTKKQLGLD